MISYQNLLNKKQWQDKSHKIKTIDNLKCQAHDCITPNAILQVHHNEEILHTAFNIKGFLAVDIMDLTAHIYTDNYLVEYLLNYLRKK